MDSQSPVCQIDHQEFCSGLNDQKKSREIQGIKESLKGLFNQITCYTYSGRPYLSWMSKNWFCLALSVRTRVDWGLLLNESLDLVELAFRFPGQTEQILKLKQTEDFRDIPNSKRFKTIEDYYAETFLFGNPGGQSSIYSDRRLKNFFLVEKQEFQKLYLERKSLRANQVNFRLQALKNCQKCRASFDGVENGLQVCSRSTCPVGRRKIYDILRLPNILMTSQIVGFKTLSPDDQKYFSKLKRMPLAKETNNIRDSLGSYKYTNQLVWRGSLANRVLSIPLSVVPPSLAAPILLAKNMEDKLPLEIREVDYIEEKANRGVFATMNLEENMVVCVYSGEMMKVSESPFWQYNDSIVQFAWTGNDPISLIPREFANVGRFFNGIIGQEEPNMKPLWTLVRNLPQETPQLVLLLITSMDVPAGTQLKWYYGRDFTQKML